MKTTYPVYVPSKGRADNCLTARFLLRDKVPFFLVVEPSEHEKYKAVFPQANILVTPHDNMRLLGVRNWIRDHSIKHKAKRHWQIDDNIYMIRRLYRGKRIPCHSGIALRVCEDFTDRYTNIGISGLNYYMFTRNTTKVPFHLNCHVYSCSLINNQMPYKWRLIYNDDTDLCLQVLSGGLCTVALNVFHASKIETMTIQGGNTSDLYQGDGRLRMARSLERMWPYVVETKRKFKRPQHHIKYSWRNFDTQLIRRKDIDWDNLKTDEYGMRLRLQKDTIESESLKEVVKQWEKDHGTGK